MLARAAIIALLAAAHASAAQLAGGAVIWVESGSCPDGTNWTPSPAAGRIFVGDSGPTSGTSNPAPSLANQEDRTHSHLDYDGSHSISATVGGGSGAYSTGGSPSPYFIIPGKYYSSGIGVTQSATSGYPFVQLLACELSPTSSTSYQVPPQAVMFFHTSPASCPTVGTGFVASPSLVGYALVASPTPQPSPSFVTTFGTAQSGSDWTLHSHTLSPGATITLDNAIPTSTTSPSSTVATAGPFSVTGSVGSSSGALPFTRALVCQSGPTTSPGSDLPGGSLVFFAASACPSAYQDTPSPVVYGRLMVNYGTSLLVTFGQTTLLYPLGSGPVPHNHGTAWATNATISVPFSASNWYEAYAAITSGGYLYGYSPSSMPSGYPPSPAKQYTVKPAAGPVVQPNNVTVPYAVLLLCKRNSAPSTSNPSSSPTFQPTSTQPTSASPTTGQPSAGPPSTGQPTPVGGSTNAPSSTNIPTHSITSAPSTASPSSLRPSTVVAPGLSKAPTTAVPTASPSSPSAAPGPSASSSLPIAAIVGGSVGALLVGAALFVWFRARRRRDKTDFAPFPASPPHVNVGGRVSNGGSMASRTTAASNPSFMSSAAFSTAPAYMSPVYVPGLGVLQPMPQFPPRMQQDAPVASYQRPQSKAVSFNRERYSTLSSTPSVQSGLPVVKVMHRFDAENEDELSCEVGERIQVLQVIDGNDWAVCRKTEGAEVGNIGLVPVTFLASYAM